jgi:hypothetical protein
MALITAFVGLALVNTSVMALIARRNELALVSLIGATPGAGAQTDRLTFRARLSAVAGVGSVL